MYLSLVETNSRANEHKHIQTKQIAIFTQAIYLNSMSDINTYTFDTEHFPYVYKFKI